MARGIAAEGPIVWEDENSVVFLWQSYAFAAARSPYRSIYTSRWKRPRGRRAVLRNAHIRQSWPQDIVLASQLRVRKVGVNNARPVL